VHCFSSCESYYVEACIICCGVVDSIACLTVL
jgi:hypothetical protein